MATDDVSLDQKINNVVSDFVFIAATDGSEYYDNGILGLAAGKYFTSLIFELYQSGIIENPKFAMGLRSY